MWYVRNIQRNGHTAGKSFKIRRIIEAGIQKLKMFVGGNPEILVWTTYQRFFRRRRRLRNVHVETLKRPSSVEDFYRLNRIMCRCSYLHGERLVDFDVCVDVVFCLTMKGLWCRCVWLPEEECDHVVLLWMNHRAEKYRYSGGGLNE